MHTPALDRLAAGGTLFQNAYCQMPVCGASRASLLSGMRPKPDRFTTYHSRADEEAPGVLTLVEHLAANGYTTVGNQKVYHANDDHGDAWSAFNGGLNQGPNLFHSERGKRIAREGQRLPYTAGRSKPKRGPSWECADIPDTAQQDGIMTEWALQQLESLALAKSPFALCYGSINVHLPFRAPKKYWDLYDVDALPLPDHQNQPGDVPRELLHTYGELRHYGDIADEGVLSDEQARKLIHGYRAGVSYLDAQVGKLLDGLDELGLTDNTAVVLWVDHGFNLGEHGLWCKHSLFETSLKVPIIIRKPGTQQNGNVVQSVVENLDVYPTVCDVLGLPRPGHLQGRSLAPLLDDATAERDAYAVSRYRNGESIRTDKYRYSYWQKDGDITARALFDIENDPGETRNLADAPEHAEAIKSLHAKLVEINQSAA